MKIGYFLSCEEHGPRELVRQARMAEEAGFSDLWISDHYHPWIDAQGHSPFVWSVIGGVAAGTERPRLFTRGPGPTHPNPPGDRGPGSGDVRGDDARPLRARRGLRRGAERAHPRRPLARGGRAHRD